MRLFVLAGLLAASAPAWAADPSYDGVTPGAPTKAKPRRSGPNLLTWIGFQKTDAGPRVFVRLSSSVEGISENSAGDEVVVHIPGVRLDTKNNGRPLDTRYFGTDVKRVWAKVEAKGVDVHVKLAKAAAAKLSTSPAPEADGSVLIYLDF
jgi:hypothetical protein